MGWEIGYDNNWNRWIGYGVIAYCDHPKCNTEIDRGLGHVCGNDARGGEHGCGLYFCGDHLGYYSENKNRCCKKCGAYKSTYYAPKPEHPDWINHLLTHDSWDNWRKENEEKVSLMKKEIAVCQ